MYNFFLSNWRVVINIIVLIVLAYFWFTSGGSFLISLLVLFPFVAYAVYSFYVSQSRTEKLVNWAKSNGLEVSEVNYLEIFFSYPPKKLTGVIKGKLKGRDILVQDKSWYWPTSFLTRNTEIYVDDKLVTDSTKPFPVPLSYEDIVKIVGENI